MVRTDALSLCSVYAAVGPFVGRFRVGQVALP
eukprot:CAMPEP_0180745574 /NCGR_PEP_ID=MMETSP1038_2-20121128/28567_1 /TAXON_ID=632150 /ORGANISM="Azadinium spinosum, Strain 3D9" /LENGTH=31 /DNA_ID= /DNA_START= /DNA_END= /DNA_ORIENTATION=